MRARGGTLLLIGVGIALLATPSVAAAKSNGLVLSSFELKGSHGYRIEVFEGEGGGLPPTATITTSRDGLRASYEVPSEFEPGMNAIFGSVGRVTVDFHRQKRSVSRLEKGCTLIKETGVFQGQFTFAGERGYSSAEATSAPGEVSRLPNGFCFGDDRKNLGVPPFLRTTQLVARSRAPHGFVEFNASASDINSKFGFDALVREAAGTMTISRTASAPATKGLFLGPGEQPRRAIVNPPPPFYGSARFLHPAGGGPTWTGSLSVSLPGAPDVALAGLGFATRLCPHQSLLRKCKVVLPPRAAWMTSAQGSGSHSQAFWDARLSWSR